MADGEEQVVLITGCSEGGIGEALAKEFSKRKCSVVATSRSLSSMKTLEKDSRIFIKELDVLSEGSIKQALEYVYGEFGRIDILVNNAGVHCVAPLAEVPLRSVEHVFSTNVYGPLRLIQAVVPHMASKRKGKIVNVGSVSAMIPGPWAGAYSASKAALHALTDSLRLELDHFGIQVINIVPGLVKSNIDKNATASYNKMPEWKLYKSYDSSIRRRTEFIQNNKCTSPEEFARKTVAVILKKKSPAWYSGGRFATGSAIAYHLPLFLRDFILKKAMKVM